MVARDGHRTYAKTGLLPLKLGVWSTRPHALSLPYSPLYISLPVLYLYKAVRTRHGAVGWGIGHATMHYAARRRWQILGDAHPDPDVGGVDAYRTRLVAGSSLLRYIHNKAKKFGRLADP